MSEFPNSSDNMATSDDENPVTDLVEASNNDGPTPLTVGSENPTTAPLTAGPENPAARTGDKRSRDEANNATSVEGNKKPRKKAVNEAHSVIERERRGKMKVLYEELQDLVPQLPPKADKTRIVDEATNYIKTLEETFKKLEKQRLEKVQGAICSSSYESTPASASASANINDISAAARLQPLVDHGSTSHDQSSGIMRPLGGLGFPPTCGFSTWISPNVVLSIAGDNACINICCSKRVKGLLTNIAYFLETYCLDLVSLQLSSDQHRSMYIINVRANAFVEGLTSGDEAMISLERIFQQFAMDILTYINNSQ